MNNLKCGLLFCLLLLSSGVEAGWLGEVVRPWVEYKASKMLIEVDTNHDGIMNQEEYERFHLIEFMRLDRDKSLKLDFKEMQRSNEPRKQDYFITVDKNKDRLISDDEYKNHAMERFRQIDLNQDQRIVKDEMKEALESYLNTW